MLFQIQNRKQNTIQQQLEDFSGVTTSVFSTTI